MKHLFMKYKKIEITCNILWNQNSAIAKPFHKCTLSSLHYNFLVWWHRDWLQSPQTSKVIGSHAIAKSGCEHIITFSFNLFLSASNNRHCCNGASLRAAIQACRRVHKTICEPLHGSLAPSQTSFRHHASILATSFP